MDTERAALLLDLLDSQMDALLDIIDDAANGVEIDRGQERALAETILSTLKALQPKGDSCG